MSKFCFMGTVQVTIYATTYEGTFWRKIRVYRLLCVRSPRESDFAYENLSHRKVMVRSSIKSPLYIYTLSSLLLQQSHQLLALEVLNYCSYYPQISQKYPFKHYQAEKTAWLAKHPKVHNKEQLLL